MYRIDKQNNQIQPLQTRSFGELGFKERPHLQEWIAKQPDVLGEELLIIQKEFSGFSDTSERLDLLALDKEGSLVIIENKLDDTGRDVTWQALKYASYCSSLSREQIREIYQIHLDRSGSGERADENICEFLEAADFDEASLNTGTTQRIILVATKFRKEVTSTVLWLLNFKLRVQCFRVSPYSMNDDLFLSFDQMIPVKDTEELMIGLAEKAQDEIEGAEAKKRRHKIRREFWSKLIAAMSGKTSLYQNISPGPESWISAGSGMSGVGFNFVATKRYVRAEVYIDRGDKEQNDSIYEALMDERPKIEDSFGGQLVWDRVEERRGCRIKAENEGNVYDLDKWPELIDFMTDAMVRLERAFREPLAAINVQLKSNP